jgi:hypothetical protein
LARAEAFKQETNEYVGSNLLLVNIVTDNGFSDSIRLLYRKALLFSAQEIKKATRTNLLQPRAVETTIAETPAARR